MLAVVGDQRVHPVDRDELLGDASTARAWWSVGGARDAAEDLAAAEPPDRRVHPLPARPNQLARMPIRSAGWARTAVVHSTVWILAISAATTSRALSNTWSSDHVGYAAASMSQTALCSRMNSVCSSSSPTHQPSSAAGAAEQRRVDVDQAVGADRELAGPAGRRTACWNSGVLP